MEIINYIFSVFIKANPALNQVLNRFHITNFKLHHYYN